MKIKVYGGTHIGIAGCYGVRNFNVKNIKEIEQIIRKENNLENATKSSYEASDGTKIHCLTDEKGLTLFEYYIA